MWMIDSYESGQEVVLVPNPNYYGEKPNIDKVVLKQVVDGDARVMAPVSYTHLDVYKRQDLCMEQCSCFIIRKLYDHYTEI